MSVNFYDVVKVFKKAKKVTLVVVVLVLRSMSRDLLINETVRCLFLQLVLDIVPCVSS